MAEVNYIGNNAPDGNCFGTAATEKISFYGDTPVVQPAAPAAAVTAGSTTTVCNTAVAEIQTALQALGLMG